MELEFEGDRGEPAGVRFNVPFGLAWTAVDLVPSTLFVANEGNHRLRALGALPLAGASGRERPADSNCRGALTGPIHTWDADFPAGGNRSGTQGESLRIAPDSGATIPPPADMGFCPERRHPCIGGHEGGNSLAHSCSS